VLLIAQEHDPVPQQGGAQLAYRGRVGRPVNADAADDRAERASYLRYLDMPERRVRRRPRYPILQCSRSCLSLI
jgi:hypothetical protein